MAGAEGGPEPDIALQDDGRDARSRTRVARQGRPRGRRSCPAPRCWRSPSRSPPSPWFEPRRSPRPRLAVPARAVWTPADKEGFGTSATVDSKLWYTLERGRLTEVFYPDLGTPSVRDLQFV